VYISELIISDVNLKLGNALEGLIL